MEEKKFYRDQNIHEKVLKSCTEFGKIIYLRYIKDI